MIDIEYQNQFHLKFDHVWSEIIFLNFDVEQKLTWHTRYSLQYFEDCSRDEFARFE